MFLLNKKASLSLVLSRICALFPQFYAKMSVELASEMSVELASDVSVEQASEMSVELASEISVEQASEILVLLVIFGPFWSF